MQKALLLAAVLLLGGCSAERLNLNGKPVDGTVSEAFQVAASAVADAVERVCDKRIRIGFIRGRVAGTNYEKSALGPMLGHFSDERKTAVYETMTSELIAELGQRGHATIVEHADAVRAMQADGNAYGREGIELAQEDVAGYVIRIDLAAKAFCVDAGTAEVLEGPSFRFAIIDVKTKVVLAKVNLEQVAG